MTHKAQHGTFQTTVGTRNDGRKIDTWTMRVDRIEGGQNFKIDFDIFLHHSMEFSVSTKDIDASRFTTLRGNNLADLREQSAQIAREEFDLRNGLTWSDWLEVRVKKSDKHSDREFTDGVSGSLGVSYNVIPRGDTTDGRAFSVSGSSGTLIEFPKNVEAVPEGESRRERKKINDSDNSEQRSSQKLIQEMAALDMRDPNTQFIYLPSTPENRAGLDAIINAISALNGRLQNFLSPGEIAGTLTKAATQMGNLLSGPDSDNQQRNKGMRP